MVAVTAGCSVIQLWAALLVGALSGPIFVYLGALLEWLRIDDPVSAVPLHAGCGLWGLLFVGLMADEQFVVQVGVWGGWWGRWGRVQAGCRA